MMITRTVALMFVALVGLPMLAPADGQPGQVTTTRADEPDALEILRKADAAARAVKNVEYEAECFGEGEYAAWVPRTTGVVKMKERRPSLLGRIVRDMDKPHKMRIEGTSEDPRSGGKTRFVVATDGWRVFRLDPDKKVFSQGELPEAEDLLGRKGRYPLVMLEFVHPTPFTDELNGKVARYEGRKEIEGVDCHVIYVVYANSSESRWYFGVQDYLPRRVDRIARIGEKEAAVALVVKNLNTQPALGDSDFRLECPAGFTRKKP